MRVIANIRCLVAYLATMSVFGAARKCGAQNSASAHLTVRPREMATATENPAAGEYPLKSVWGVLVSVPPQCMGKQRCPLFLVLPGGGTTAREMTDWLRPVANKYGMILLAPTNYTPSVIDSAMKETLQRFAIDPDKIAVIGRCASGPAGMRFGIENLHIFSRIGAVSGGAEVQGIDPKNTSAMFLLDVGLHEAAGMFRAARTLRSARHPVTVIVGMRGHEHQSEDYDFVGHWLTESWATLKPANRSVPTVAADAVPALTVESFTHMTTFWTCFAQEPDSIRVTARRAHLREVLIPIGTEQMSVWVMDLPALAAKYPSVAADLQKAGLTAQQHDAYRIALISAYVNRQTVDGETGTIEATSTLARNIEFLNTHPDEFKTLSAAGTTQSDNTPASSHPLFADKMGSMGIWRTP